jgi:dimethylargininase
MRGTMPRDATLRHAIVRPPSENFADGLTTAELGLPDVARARHQHAAYVAALERCGLEVTALPEDPDHPDSTFVEDTAVIFGGGAMLTRPGAPSRTGEVAPIREALGRRFGDLEEIAAPGTLDGGDVCEAGDRVYIGISERTNEEGARQLAGFLGRRGAGAVCVDIRGIAELLHLKSGIASLGGNRLLVTEALAGNAAFRGAERVIVEPREEYAANAVRINGTLVVAAGFPRLERRFREAGEALLVLEMSEFQKMDGGLSCLSLRF